LRVLGIDPGTAITGYGIVESEGDNLRAVAFGSIQTSKDEPLDRRLKIIFEALEGLIQEYSPHAGVVEELFFSRNTRTALSVGQSRGVALLALARAGIAAAEYTPKEVKLAITGYGGADKGQIQHMVMLLLNLEEIPRPDDAADALALAICHLNNMRIAQMDGAQ
jgi:crossover junction endodeoxyribonuclease RuvC